MEQSDRQIKLSEAALRAKTVLRRMQDDLLFLARLRADGSVDTSARSEKTVSIYKKNYKDDLMQYKEKWLNALNVQLETQEKDFNTNVDGFMKWITDKKKLSNEDAQLLKEKINEKYKFDPMKYYARVMNNISKESMAIDNGKDLEDYVDMIKKVKNALNENRSIDEVLPLVGVKVEYYEPALTKQQNENDEDFEERVEETNKVTLRYNKAMLMTNPNDPDDPRHQKKRYSVSQMSVLYDIQNALRTNRALACATSTHVLSIHDTKLYNGRWFVLVKDPHNINSFEYTKDENGKLHSDGHLLSKVEKVRQHFRVRKLDGTMLSAVLGTSWWELDDFIAKIGDYIPFP